MDGNCAPSRSGPPLSTSPRGTRPRPPHGRRRLCLPGISQPNTFLPPTSFWPFGILRPCLPAKLPRRSAARLPGLEGGSPPRPVLATLCAEAAPCSIGTRPPRLLLAPAFCHVSAKLAAEAARGLCVLHLEHASAGSAAQQAGLVALQHDSVGAVVFCSFTAHSYLQPSC